MARFQFCSKPNAAVAMMHSGIPPEHRNFWERLGVAEIQRLFISLSVTRRKVLSIIDCPCTNPAEERVHGYLMTMIGNMRRNDLVNFVRFVTGSSVCIARKIDVIFNSSFGFSRRPFGCTCTNTLGLSTNYQDFNEEWKAILSSTDDEWKWRMDFC